MAFLSEATRPHSIFGIRWISTLIASAKAHNAKMAIYRQTLGELQMMNDAELNDIGLSHAMIRDVAREAAGLT